MQYINQLFENAYYHCLHYTISKKIHILERVFWIVWIILSICCVSYIIDQSVTNYNLSKVTIKVNTDYLSFEVPFPAVFFCEEKELPGKFDILMKNLNFKITDKQASLDIENFVRTTTFIRPLESNTNIVDCTKPDVEYCQFARQYSNNLSIFTKYIRAECEEIFTSCLFNGKEFNCCDNFLPIDTYEGKCFALNSFNAKTTHLKKLNKYTTENYKNPKIMATSTKFKLKHTFMDNPANLSIELAHRDMSLWYMANNNVPTRMFQKNHHLHEKDFRNFAIGNIFLRVNEIKSDTTLWQLDLKQRECQFSYERDISKSVFPSYSQAGCEIDCLRRAQLKHCQCVLHLLPNQNQISDKLCNLSGLMCLELKKSNILNELSTKCFCINHCLTYEINNVGIVPDIEFLTNYQMRNNRSEKRINLIVRTPTVQYIRFGDKDTLDFIVSLGGAISLFIGCSFLILIQIIDYFFIRPLNDYCIVQERRL
ncbi:hypothetical protein ABEB36_002684 [Hypothenemus hampei]|uniref:Uncharacterized protein n=1 Tax=Hypothenemus hampei TaxID=57062 RepID=A0ABD1F718_HYPHA